MPSPQPYLSMKRSSGVRPAVPVVPIGDAPYRRLGAGAPEEFPDSKGFLIQSRKPSGLVECHAQADETMSSNP